MSNPHLLFLFAINNRLSRYTCCLTFLPFFNISANTNWTRVALSSRCIRIQAECGQHYQQWCGKHTIRDENDDAVSRVFRDTASSFSSRIVCLLLPRCGTVRNIDPISFVFSALLKRVLWIGRLVLKVSKFTAVQGKISQT